MDHDGDVDEEAAQGDGGKVHAAAHIVAIVFFFDDGGDVLDADETAATHLDLKQEINRSLYVASNTISSWI